MGLAETIGLLLRHRSAVRGLRVLTRMQRRNEVKRMRRVVA